MREIWQAGQQVRLISDPGRVGTLSGKTRTQGGITRYFVHYPDGSSWVIAKSLELIDSGNTDDPYSMLENKQFGRVNDLRRNLTCIQLSGRLANLVYSMDTTNTEFFAYQYKPVLSFLEAQSKGILIADEVGLGKTIEAGLIWTEMRARTDARRLLVVCPAMLREKWRDELAFRFGIDATLMNAAELCQELKRDRHNVPPGKAIVCSYDGLRPPRQKMDDEAKGITSKAKKVSPRQKLAQLMAENEAEEPLFDMVIFDEAHKMRNAESATSKLGRLIREVSENIILLSATPINLHSQDLYQLLNLVDEDTFSSEHIFPSILTANEPLVRAQRQALDKSSGWEEIETELNRAQQHYLLRDNNQLQAILDDGLNDEELKDDSVRIQLANRIERCNLLSKAVIRTRKADVKELRVIRDPMAPHVEMTEVETELYQRVTEIVRRYAVDRDISEGFLLATPQRQLSSSMYAAMKSWQGRSSKDDFQLYEDLGTDSSVGDSAPLMQHIVAGVQGIVELEELREYDSKFSALLDTLSTFFTEYPDEKVIIFSYFRGTLRYLAERLGEHHISSEVLMGGMRETKQDIIDRFKEKAGARVLLASEVASEGVDLQFCRVLINYDLPWNPMRIEQRIGRIDRHGQKADRITILNFCYHDTIDQRIYNRLYERLDVFKRSLGDMEAILGDEISLLTKDLFCAELTPEQEQQRIEQTSLAIEQLRQTTDQLESEASNLIAHSGHILQEVNAAHEFSKRITEADLITFVKDFLERHCTGFEFFQPKTDQTVYEIILPSQTAAELGKFVQKNKMHGLTSLDQGGRRTVVFRNKMVKSDHQHEVINQTHPLIQFISEYLRQHNEAFVPLVATSLAQDKLKDLLPGQYVAVVKRLSFEGIRIEEKLVSRLIHLESDELFEPNKSFDVVNAGRLQGKDWPNVSSSVDVAAIDSAFFRCDEQLQSDYEKEAAQKIAENNDRVGLQLSSAKKHFERQLNSRKSALFKHQLAGRSSLIKATEGQIRKLTERFEQREAELNQSAVLKHHIHDVCHLVINVERSS
ncbi:SNF2-related protein [Vibrio alginolyticus]|uniref:SNF2-related protein n=1 Tax=Vibrio alginolyticus TaxID=663 RepID=UPI000802A3EA|nr:SNF2-related protein [Vibrio alginolyticus]ANP67170.1 hypothetical protein BAU10_19615 [Vibrio alginolyticus]